ncbi:hypothetical protein [Candidatus Magnetomonas plexicatena]|uniref:hypothetical protein n=1 Tax=Candidatus Magnetomonas plexicatena TaxID=2552947 RepID=UPI001100E679|nr:hypothetical protein E2O03_012745 [Nitrospirales bacterium LBB_01]
MIKYKTKVGKDTKFAYILTSVFFILTLILILHHAMWRDELQAWMIAASSNSFSELFQNIKYEGHPSLWFVILYLVKHVTTNPAAMKIVHLLIATASAFVFLKFAPFNNRLKGLFIFGYFSFFEYAVISRDYAIGILFLFIFCAYFGKDFKNRNYVFLSIILFLMCQSNVLAVILAIALAITIFLEPLLLKDFIFYRSWRFYTSILIFAAGLMLSVLQMNPPADASLYHPVINPRNIPGKIVDQMSVLWSAFVPVPRIQLHFWNTNFLDYLPVEMRHALRLTLSSGILLFSIFILIRKKIPTFYFIISTFGIITFGGVFYGGYLRHWGHTYFAFVTALWLHNYYSAPKTSISAFFRFFERNKNRFLTAIFSLGVLAALTANTIGFMYPFSASKQTADYIKQNSWQNMPIAGHWFYAASGVSAYLDRAFYYPLIDTIGTFSVWKYKWDKTDILMQVSKYRDFVKSDVLFIVNERPLPDELVKSNGIVPLKNFTVSIVESEKFFLYMIPY